MSIRAVLLDLGDTLIKLHPLPRDFGARFHAYIESAGIAATALPGHELHEALIREARALQDHREARYESILAELLGAGSLVDGSRHASALARIMHEGDVGRFEAPAGLSADVERLRDRGLRLAIVSNTTTDPTMMRDYLRSSGLTPLFDAVVFSVEHGYRKPAASIYSEALGALGAAPTEAVFVGDRLIEDVRGPLSLGMRAILMHRFRQEDPAGVPDAVVRSVSELEAVVTRFNTASDE